MMVGLVQGGSQALSRSLFGNMVPKAQTAEFFGFYDMSSKFAGMLGPLCSLPWSASSPAPAG